MSMKDQLEEVIRRAFEIGDENLDWDWTSDDVSGWDSVGHLNLILELEKVFGVKFDIEELFEVEKLGDIEPLLKRKKGL